MEDNSESNSENKAPERNSWSARRGNYAPKRRAGKSRANVPYPVSREEYGAELAGKMVALLKRGETPWGGEDHTGSLNAPHNPVTGTVYGGSNQIALKVGALERGYTSDKWFTGAAIKALGGYVEKGSTGVKIKKVTAVTVLRHPSEYDSEGNLKQIKVSSSSKAEKLQAEGWRAVESFFAPSGYSTLFNLEQIKGDLDQYHDIAPVIPMDVNPTQFLMDLVKGLGVDVVERGNRVNYIPNNDTIFIPRRDLFERPEDYDVALAHGAALATGSANRMAREGSGDFNSLDYPREELVAQLASGLICSKLGVGSRLVRSEYTDKWIAILEANPQSAMTFIDQAEKAAGFVLGTERNSPEVNRELHRSMTKVARDSTEEERQKNVDLMYPEGFNKKAAPKPR